MDDLYQLNHSILSLQLYADNPHSADIKKPIGRATGFIWKEKDSFFLISNWHVFTGRNHDTGTLTGLTPKYVNIHFGNGDAPMKVELYDEGEKPRWIQSPHLKVDLGDVPEEDIAILPLPPRNDRNNLHPLNLTLEACNARADVSLEVTIPLSIVGYPLDVNNSADSPIWVTAYVASLPTPSSHSFLANGFPYSGMSGAPAFWVYPNRPIKLDSGGAIVNAISGDFIQFVGGLFRTYV